VFIEGELLGSKFLLLQLFINPNYMTTIPKTLSYKDFLDKVGFLNKPRYSDPDISYGDLHDKVIERLGNKPIANYSEFMSMCGNLGHLFYWDLYKKLYPENANSKEKKIGGKSKTRKSKATRRKKY
jgi:hypothetical protein